MTNLRYYIYKKKNTNKRIAKIRIIIHKIIAGRKYKLQAGHTTGLGRCDQDPCYQKWWRTLCAPPDLLIKV